MTIWRTGLACVLVAATGATAIGQRNRFGPMNYPVKAYDGRFTFVRMSYTVGFGGGFGGPCGREAKWAHDYPDGERNFMQILTTVSNVPGHVEESNVLAFDDPDMFKFPVIYLVEPGCWFPTDEQIDALRDYLSKGGFLIVDDFPYWAWPNFQQQMTRVFPDGLWKDLDVTHPIFHAFFEIATLDIVPAYPALGERPIFRALFEQNDPAKRVQVVANYQNDLSEFWEYSEQGDYAIDRTNEAYKVGVNQFMYGITH